MVLAYCSTRSETEGIEVLIELGSWVRYLAGKGSASLVWRSVGRDLQVMRPFVLMAWFWEEGWASCLLWFDGTTFWWMGLGCSVGLFC